MQSFEETREEKPDCELCGSNEKCNVPYTLRYYVSVILVKTQKWKTNMYICTLYLYILQANSLSETYAVTKVKK